MEYDDISKERWEWRVIETDHATGKKYLCAPFYRYKFSLDKSNRTIAFVRHYESRKAAFSDLEKIGLINEAKRSNWLLVQVTVGNIIDPFINESLIDEL